MKHVQLLSYLFILIILSTFNSITQTTNSGTVSGYVRDAESGEELIGATVVVKELNKGAVTNTYGFYSLTIPVQKVTIQFSYIGYEALTKTDVIVRPKRITFVEAELKLSPIKSDEVVITGGYFVEHDEQPVSITSFSREEIRRAPGSAGDVNRIMMSLLSVSKVNDQSNNLIVRGGNPIENTFFIDN